MCCPLDPAVRAGAEAQASENTWRRSRWPSGGSAARSGSPPPGWHRRSRGGSKRPGLPQLSGRSVGGLPVSPQRAPGTSAPATMTPGKHGSRVKLFSTKYRKSLQINEILSTSPIHRTVGNAPHQPIPGPSPATPSPSYRYAPPASNRPGALHPHILLHNHILIHSYTPDLHPTP